MQGASVPILEAEDIHKVYRGGEKPVIALGGVSLKLEAGDFVAIMGPSGCGKSTLLHICGAMDRPTSGRLQMEGIPLSTLDDNHLTRLRRRRVGFVFQFFNLLPTLTVLENIGLPLLLSGVDSAETERRSGVFARRIGLQDRLGHYPQQLSGGEMQRAAIARAVVHQPALLIADEPTGNLDSENGANILDLMSQLNRETRITILLATHSLETAAPATRIYGMRDGRIERTELSHPAPFRKVGPLAAI